MVDDSVLSWIVLTILSYGIVFYIFAKACAEEEAYEQRKNKYY